MNVYIHSDLTGEIIKAFYQVYNTLGFGFLEKVYQNALLHELRKSGFEAEAQRRLSVFYDGMIVGEFFADIIVNETVVLELKSAKVILDAHKAQTLNYLKATQLELALILNFGPDPQIARIVHQTAKQNKKKIRENLS
jgi:GxxExxY protein